MELWGASLLLCLFSLLTQVTAEPPTPKVKKAANAKKGTEGGGGPLRPLGNRSPSPPLALRPLPFVLLLDKSRGLQGRPLVPGQFSNSRGGGQNCKGH